jgi:threonyl-tRNA synthetase
VSFRFRNGDQLNGVPVAQAVEQIAGFAASRRNNSPTAADFPPVP